ncbi:hypothetical protein [Deinococcus fonticola]|uniref:hypothetical protein n=1 Tax=Deinococcus fonticola TaxID=2528713 RepID=UPI00142F9C60|nr:hypothetical protein [Deinococcus fonticola]
MADQRITFMVNGREVYPDGTPVKAAPAPKAEEADSEQEQPKTATNRRTAAK